MSNWTPEWQISINGNTENYAGTTIANLSITSGRTNIYEQPVAGYAYLELINLDNTAYNFSAGDKINIMVKDSSGDFVDIYGGRITDFAIGVKSVGENRYTTSATITALGALALLARANWESALAKDYEGDQIYEILSDLLVNNWNEVAAALTWANYDSTTTWADAENVGLGEIDRPGNYEMVARGADATNSYLYASLLANSGLGYLYEDSSGRIGYANSTHRQNYLAADGYVGLDANHALGVGIRSVTRLGDIRNYIQLNYKSNLSGTEIVSDTQSIAQYGRYAEIFDTTIDAAADAIAVAERRLALRSFPRAYFDSITFALGNPEVDDSDRDALLNIFMGMPINIVNLPPNIIGGQFQGYVEGWTFRASYNGLSITLNASPLEFSQVAVKWEQVSASEAWNTISGILTWENAIGAVA